MVLGPAADDPGERQADQDIGDARGERGGAPAEGGERPGDHRDENAAEREAERKAGQRAGAPALEPVDQRDVDREEAAEARADRHHDEGAVELEQGLDLAEQHEADAEHHHADADQPLRAEAVDDPAEHRAEDRGFHLVQGRRARQRGLAPAAVVAQHRDVRAEGLHQQRRLQELQAAAGGDHVPAVEDPLHRAAAQGPPRPF